MVTCQGSTRSELVVLDIATKLYALDVIQEYSVLHIATKLYTLDEYSSKARIRTSKEITSTENTTSI